MKAAIIAFLVLFLAPAYAQEIVKYDVDVDVSDLQLRQVILLTINNTHTQELEEFSYPLGDSVENVRVSDSYGELKSSVSGKGDRTYVGFVFRQPLGSGETKSVTIEYASSGQISKYSRGFLKGDTYTLKTSHSILANVKSFELRIRIPEGYGVVEYSPEAEKTSTGRQHVLSWSYSEPIPPAFRQFRAIVIYEPLFGTAILYYAMIGVIMLIILILVYRYLREEGITLQDYLDRKKYMEQKIDILKEDEQAIMKLIIEKDGIDQRDIQDITGFSKTKVSKILAELEKREVIRKEQYGRKNKIYLTKKVKET